MRRPGALVGGVAARWGVSDGQVYTAIIGSVVALAAAIGGIPPTLADRVAAPAGDASRLRARPPEATAETTTTTVPSIDATGDVPAFPGAGAFAPEATASSGFGAGSLDGPAPPAAPPAAPRLPVGAFRVFATIPSPGAPQGIAIAPNNRVLVATNNGDGRGADGHPVLFSYNDDNAPTALVVDRVASGGGIHDIVVPPGGDGNIVYALASNPAAVLKIDVADKKVTTFASVPDIASCATAVGREPCEPSPLNNAPKPVAAAFDAKGELIVADAGQAVLWRVKADRSIGVFFKAPEFAALDGLSGIALGANNTLFLTVARSVSAAGGGLVFRLADNTLTQVAQTANGSLPRGLTVARSGRLYVTLSGAGRVAVLSPEGATVSTLPSDPSLSFDTPVRVVFSPVGLMVVEQVPRRAAAGRVLELGVADEALRATGT